MRKILERLKIKWGLSSVLRVVLVLLSFSMAGMTVVIIRNYFYDFIGVSEAGFWTKLLLFFVFFLPTHNLLLLVYGFFLGQFAFFWDYEKRFFQRISRLLRFIGLLHHQNKTL